MLLMAAVGFIFTACQKDDTTARAILASVNTLEFKGEGAAPETILVTSDGDWTVEAPEWVTVTPSQGTTGQTEVTIEVADNFRDGALDNPRRDAVQFTGANLWAHAIVKIRQDGDKYRDPKDYSVADFEAAADETVVRIPGVIVACLTSDGFIATTADGKQNVYVKKPVKAVAVGDKVSVQGEKWFTDEKMSYLTGDRIQTEGTAEVPTQTPVDATSTLDALKGTTPLLITVYGAFNGTSVKVADQSCSVFFENPTADMNLKNYAGHNIQVTGYYYGTAAPVVKMVPVSIEDKGLNAEIYWTEDFEWIEPWCAIGDGKGTPAADIVGTNQGNTYQPQLTKSILDGVTAEKAFLDRGYEFSRVCHSSKTPGECIYIQHNYLKFGKTGYQAGITLPKMEKLGDGVLEPTLSFDACGQRQGDNTYDPTEIVVVVINGASEVQFPVGSLQQEAGSVLTWKKFNIVLEGITLNKDTRIQIRNIDSQLGKNNALRWHIDNIMLSKSK